jgi:hypothetical protein
MGRRGEEEVQPDPNSWKGSDRSGERSERDYRREESGKGDRVPEAAVAKRVLIGDAEAKAKDVEIGSRRTERAKSPKAAGSSGRIERRNQRESRSDVAER